MHTSPFVSSYILLYWFIEAHLDHLMVSLVTDDLVHVGRFVLYQEHGNQVGMQTAEHSLTFTATSTTTTSMHYC